MDREGFRERGEGETGVGWTGEGNWWSGLGLEID